MSYHSQHLSQRSSVSVLANVADHQETQYRRYIEQNETMGLGIAMRLEKGEHFETLLGKDFCEECRQKLKVLAKDNVAKERQLRAYASAIRVVIDQASTNMEGSSQREAESNEENEENHGAAEFKDQMETAYANALEQLQENSLLVTQEPSYLKLVRQLGDDQPQDDELAVVVNPSGNNDLSKIKCPLTMALFQDPVRSKICKHSYERTAIEQHIQKTRTSRGICNCPVPGCVNRSMHLTELEDDLETLMRVRRHKKRESASQKARQKSALDDEDDETEWLE